MLFDLRSRGRRRTVQAVYLGLAFLMGGGLVLFGVGAGNGFGGILNAFTGSGSSSAAKAGRQPAGEERAQGDQADAHRSSGLVAARPGPLRVRRPRQQLRPQHPNYTSGGRTSCAPTQAWQRYLPLTTHPDPNVALLAARAYGALSDYASEATPGRS